jgi:hypothetical protein
MDTSLDSLKLDLVNLKYMLERAESIFLPIKHSCSQSRSLFEQGFR